MARKSLFIMATLSALLTACTPPPPSGTPATRQRESGYRESRPEPSRKRPSEREEGWRDQERGNERAERGQQRRVREASGSPGEFDFYLLNLSWSPEFCATHPGMPECASHPGFVLHGLWPQNNDGTYPQHCSNGPGPVDGAQFRDLYPDAGLMHHEWQTHGTCSGLAPESFFATARNAMRNVRIPQQLSSLDHQTSLTPEAILALFTSANPSLPRKSLALSCGNNYLTAVEVCLSKELHPVACQQVRSCRANSVQIPPPGATNGAAP